MRPARKVLVIKLAALGDVVQAFPPFVHIRQAHPDAHITLLTTPPYASLAAASPYFDAIETDGRPKRAMWKRCCITPLRLAGLSADPQIRRARRITCDALPPRG